MLNPTNIKNDFPIFKHHPNLVYLDSAATSLKPQIVIDKMTEYYSQYSTNIHRGIYALAEKATEEYENSRALVAKFIGANDSSEIVFTRNATESLNLIAYALGRVIVAKNDEIVTTIMEHHSNFVPWQMLAFENGANFKVIDIDQMGYLKIDLEEIVSNKTKIFALTYVSNVLGTINPVKEIISAVKKINPKVIVVVDAANAVPFLCLDIQNLGADFVAFSGHKILGPTGVGVLWGKKSLLEQMFPFNFGGGMIQEVSMAKTTFREPPYKFEAGTPHIAGVIATGAAIAYLLQKGMKNIKDHEQLLVDYAIKRLKEQFGKTITIYGPALAHDRAGLVSFNLKKIHPHDMAQILDEQTIAIRGGHHCTMPLHKRLGTTATARASFYLYNNEEDVDKLIQGLKRVVKILKEV